MCGRNSLFVDQQSLEDRTEAELVTDGGYTPRYNIAPGEPLEMITNETTDVIDQLHWGLIPFWADEREEGITNARSETAAEKRVFERAWESRPCLVLSSGFYEWQETSSGPKQPYRIHREEDPAFAMAGLWEEWEGDDEAVTCVTILTTEPNNLWRQSTTGCQSCSRPMSRNAGSRRARMSTSRCAAPIRTTTSRRTRSRRG